MPIYKLIDDDGNQCGMVDTNKALCGWEEDTVFDGRNRISVATGSQWHHEKLYRSQKGRYYLEYWSQWQGATPGARLVTHKEAAAWLLQNAGVLPDELSHLLSDIME